MAQKRSTTGQPTPENQGSPQPTSVKIKPIRWAHAEIPIIHITEYVQHRFSEKAKAKMEAQQRAGGAARTRGRSERTARDFESDVEAAMYRSAEGWYGVPASQPLAAVLKAGKVLRFDPDRLRMAIEPLPDGQDVKDGTKLIRLRGKPEPTGIMHVRNANGVADLRNRPMWRRWGFVLRVRFDETFLSLHDVVNLVDRAMQQVGIGEGRKVSRRPDTPWQGWGIGRVATLEEVEAL